KIARLHEKIKNTRKHYLNKIANKIVLENDIIVTENLKVRDMSKNKRLAKYILDASFSKLCSLLEWKSKLQGKFYYKIDTYYPSSQMCSYCGHKDTSLKDLSIREYKCQSCGRELDRDINASINILFEGLKLHYQN
ncbi:MAG TPA: transposase, partial [Candidatus Onthousia faecavium]|nr:transposase [Candidatus Onthousia faecavium]